MESRFDFDSENGGGSHGYDEEEQESNTNTANAVRPKQQRNLNRPNKLLTKTKKKEKQNEDHSSSSSPPPFNNFTKFLSIVLFGIVAFYVTDRMDMFEAQGEEEGVVVAEASSATTSTMMTTTSNKTTDIVTVKKFHHSKLIGPLGGPSSGERSSATAAGEHLLIPQSLEQKQPKTNKIDTSQLSPTTNIVPSSSGGRKRVYKTRGQPMNETERDEMIKEWGSWEFTEIRPTRDDDSFYTQFPNRDVDTWPDDAWQRNTSYLESFLQESIKLVERAQNAILKEYTSTKNNASLIFEVQQYLDDEFETVQFKGKNQHGGTRGGWTTVQSWKGLKRRLLHAIMTEDSFIVAMTGHSAAAGHGNLFQQSYTLQIQWILESVFARLGVYHEARNFGMGGLGTAQTGLGAAAVMGPDVDFTHWDSSMTEHELHFMELIARQQVMAGSKVPVFWNFYPDVSKELVKLGVDIGAVGTGMDGIPLGTNIDEIENEFPWAVQYVNCDKDINSLCRAKEYIGHCWVDRPDFTPPQKQKPEPSGRASWHPGNRKHQVTGRILTMTILQALLEGLQDWYQAPDYLLPNEDWHVTEHYKTIREKVSSKSTEGYCYKTMEDNFGLGFFCQHPFQARTEFTPRHAPSMSNIRSIMPPSQRQSIILPSDMKNLYNPPDVFQQDLHPPKGAIDVLNILEAGVSFSSIVKPDYDSQFYKPPSGTVAANTEQGLGIQLSTYAGDDFCDGTVDSFCNKGSTNDCLLYNHNDGRHGLRFDGYSGWMVLNIPKLENGYIVIKVESWYGPKEGSPATWTGINNNNTTRRRRQQQQGRALKAQPIPYCDEFHFETMIDRKLTSYNLNTTREMLAKGHIQRVVETLTILKDPNFSSSSNDNGEIEVAIRIVGCGHSKTWSLTHIYWS